MSEDRLDYWGAYLASLTPPLRLMDWTLKLQTEPSADTSIASVCPTYGRKLATIRVCKDWEMLSREEQRHSLTHELMHLHLCPIQNVYNRMVEGRTEGWLKLGHEFHQEAVEFSVDILADIVAPFLPLPPVETEQEAA